MDHERQGPTTTDVIERQGAFEDRDAWPVKGYCRIERALDLVGTRSAMLVIRELFYGGTRYEELTRRTGLSEAVVAGRLKQLHGDGLVERRPYQEAGQRRRDEYVLTDRGRALFPVIVALAEFGDVVSDDPGTGVQLVHRDCEAPLEPRVRCSEGHDVPLDQAAVRLRDEDHVTALRDRARAEH